MPFLDFGWIFWRGGVRRCGRVGCTSAPRGAWGYARHRNRASPGAAEARVCSAAGSAVLAYRATACLARLRAAWNGGDRRGAKVTIDRTPTHGDSQSLDPVARNFEVPTSRRGRGWATRLTRPRVRPIAIQVELPTLPVARLAQARPELLTRRVAQARWAGDRYSDLRPVHVPGAVPGAALWGAKGWGVMVTVDREVILSYRACTGVSGRVRQSRLSGHPTTGTRKASTPWHGTLKDQRHGGGVGGPPADPEIQARNDQRRQMLIVGDVGLREPKGRTGSQRIFRCRPVGIPCSEGEVTLNHFTVWKAFKEYESGRGSRQSAAAAIESLRRVRNKSAMEKFVLGVVLSSRTSDFYNRRAAIRYFSECVDDGIPEAAWMVADMYGGVDASHSDLRRRFHWLQRGASCGDSTCAFHAGLAMLVGVGVEKSVETGLAHIHAAKALPDAVAIVALHKMCVMWPEKNRAHINDMESAAERGSSEAMLMLGAIGQLGLVPSDRCASSPVNLYRRASRIGNAGAKWNLYACFRNGLLVAKDLKRASYWRREAFGAGICELSEPLGSIGKRVFPQDKVCPLPVISGLVLCSYHEMFELLRPHVLRMSSAMVQ